MEYAETSRLINIVGTLATTISDQIREATQHVSGLSGSGPAAIVALQQFADGCTTQRLAEVVGLSHSGAVRLVDRLEELDLAERESGDDARSGSIVLTRAGRDLSVQISASRARVVSEALDGLSTDEQRELGPLVEALLTGITLGRLVSRREGDAPRAWMCRLCDLESCQRDDGMCPTANAASTYAPVDT